MTHPDPAARPVVVGFDPQTLDRSPVQFAVAAARLTNSPLIVVSVCFPEPIVDSLPLAYGDEELARLGEQAFTELASELRVDDVPVDFRELHGTSAARTLHEVAEVEGARLLVVGSTNRGAFGQVMPGSTADRLTHGAPCAVAVIPRDWVGTDGLRTIGVAFADTEEGFDALLGAYSLAARAGAVLRVLSVARVHAAMYAEIRPSGRFESGRNLNDVEGAAQLELETTVRAAVARIPGLASDVVVEIDAFIGDPAETLNRVSQHLDLLVCGSRGYGPLRSAVLGGVSRRVMAAAQCPVIVLARGVEAPLDPVEVYTEVSPSS